MSTKLPTLTSSGWLSDTVTISNKLMDYFLASDFSQTQFYPGEVASLPYIVQEHGHDPDRLVESVRDTLTKYFQRYFRYVRLNVRKINLEDEKGQYGIEIDLIAESDDGKRSSLGRLIEIGDSKILNVQLRENQ